MESPKQQPVSLTFLAVFPSEPCVGAVAVHFPKLDNAESSIETRVLFGTQVLQVTLNALAVEQGRGHLTHFQVGDEAHERRLVLHRAGGQGGQADVRRDATDKEVTDDGHFFTFGANFGALGLAVHHKHGLTIVSSEEDHVPAVVTDSGLHVDGGGLSTMDGET